MGTTASRFLAALAVLGLICAVAPAVADELDCWADSVLPAPAGYAERCGLSLPPEEGEAVEPWRVPGDLAFYKNNFPAPQNLKTAPLPTLGFATIGPNAQPLFAMEFDLSGTNLYAVDNTSRQLGTLDQTTGVFTPIAALTPDPVGMTVTGLTFDPTSGTAYFTATNGATANLWTINVATAALTLVGPITGFPFTIDIAIDGSGQMWGHDIAVDQLISINKATGAAVGVGSTTLAANFAQGMMYDITDDTLYGCAFVIAPAQQGVLVTFNRATGAATIVGGPVPDELECAFRGITEPDIAVDPASLSSFQVVDTQVVLPLDITNNGTGDLDWDITESLPFGSARQVLRVPGRQEPILPHTRVAPPPANEISSGSESFSRAAGEDAGKVVEPERGEVPDGTVTITHSASQSIISLNSVSCNAGGLHTDNSYIRRFDLGAFGITSAFDVTQVEVGVEQAVGNGGTQPVTMNLYTWDPLDPFTFASFNLIGTAGTNVTDQSLTILTVPVTGTAPAGSTLVVELFTPNGQPTGNSFFVGSNNLGQTDASFIAAAACGIAEPTDLAVIGFPGMHLVMNVTGEVGCGDDLPWVSANPTAGTTVPAATDTVDVTFDSTGLTLGGVYTGALCVNSNDPDTPTVQVPLTLEVDTMPFLDGFETGDTTRWSFTIP